MCHLKSIRIHITILLLFLSVCRLHFYTTTYRVSYVQSVTLKHHLSSWQSRLYLIFFLDIFCIINLKWGVAGAAIATVFSQAVSGVLCLILIVMRFPILHIHSEERKFDPELSKRLLIMGIPMGLQYSITAIGSMIMQSANNTLGTLYVSAFTAGIKIKQF